MSFIAAALAVPIFAVKTAPGAFEFLAVGAMPDLVLGWHWVYERGGLFSLDVLPSG